MASPFKTLPPEILEHIRQYKSDRLQPHPVAKLLHGLKVTRVSLSGNAWFKTYRQPGATFYRPAVTLRYYHVPGVGMYERRDVGKVKVPTFNCVPLRWTRPEDQ